jgi:hypothetical protein
VTPAEQGQNAVGATLVRERLPSRTFGGVERARAGALARLLAHVGVRDASAREELHQLESERVGDEFVMGCGRAGTVPGPRIGVCRRLELPRGLDPCRTTPSVALRAMPPRRAALDNYIYHCIYMR